MLLPSPSFAAEPQAEPQPESQPWIKRYAPRRNTAELGIYGGISFPARRHELFGDGGGFQRFRTVAPVIGGRIAYLPLRFLGLEVEGGASPTRTSNDERATLWHARGHVVGQLGLWRVVPFVLAGAGGFGVASPRAAVGTDVDIAFHFGGGVKLAVTKHLQLRLDVRDVVAARRGVAKSVSHTPEILLGIGVVFGGKRKDEPTQPGDRDRDGFIDPKDACPDEPGVAPDGCPIRDRDRDGFVDPKDECPDDPGVAPDGCPIRDRDRDGFIDPEDACPDEPGVAPDGCPLRDRDGDGILDPNDRCPDEPETRNGFEDTDGCPDELPEQVRMFNGVIEGIEFALDKDVIRPHSFPILDRAIVVLAEYPSINIEVSGHTDSTGTHVHNIDLSRRRAESVKRYLVEHGIATERVTTRGVGPDEPLAENTSERGRQKNRRIEFRVMPAVAAAADKGDTK